VSFENARKLYLQPIELAKTDGRTKIEQNDFDYSDEKEQKNA
jgi:hypothetical protein